jgi:formylmethanofuran dehydrogenase subunit E
MDYGIMTATFVNLSNEKTSRILSTEESRELSQLHAPEVEEKSQSQIIAYKRMLPSVLFRVQRVRVNISELDLPGPTRQKGECSQCGQVIRDGREVLKNRKFLCNACTDDCYFSHAREITWPEMNWSPQKGPIKKIIFGNQNGL